MKQEIVIFKDLATEDYLKELEANAEQYTGLHVDMEDKEARKFVKDRASLISGIRKALNRKRIDTKKAYNSQVDEEAAYIDERLAAANAPYDLLIEAHKKERAEILAEEKRIKEAEELALQLPIDHEEALQLNKLFDFEKAEAKKAQEERDEEIRQEAIKQQKVDAELAAQQAEAKRLADIQQAKDEAEQEAKQKIIDEENARLKRIADTEHVTAISKAAKESLMQQTGLTEEQAIAVVKAIRSGKVTNLTITL